VRNLTRAQRKKAQRKFKVGDVVTFGIRTWAHRVVDVTPRGVVIDVTSCKDIMPSIDWWARKQADGRYFMTVLYDHNTQGDGPCCRFAEQGVVSGPPEHTNMVPDKEYPLGRT